MASFVFPGLDQSTAQSEADFYRDSGATVTIGADGAGTFTLTATYPEAPAPAPAPAPPPPPSPRAPPPAPAAGVVICIDRLRCEMRPGAQSPRTVGTYQAFLNGNPIAGANGYCVERQGPGDNTAAGVQNQRRIAAGTYPLFTHEGANEHYRTIGYAAPGALGTRPWPCLGVENTGDRSGILMHCAAGYYMSVGCINLTSFVANASTNLDFSDSWNHVVQLIDSVRANTAGFPANNNVQIPSCTLVIRGEPDLRVTSDSNDDLQAAIAHALRLNEIGSGSPYVLCFAGKGNSGASFGAMQGDLAAKQSIVQQTFRNALAAAGFGADEIQTFIDELSVHLVSNPLSAADTTRINDALLASKNLVDAMDQNILQGVLADVDRCITAAAAAGRHIDPIALIYMALWINMTGPPTLLLTWLQDGNSGMSGVPSLGQAVGEDQMKGYLQVTSYFRANPGNLPNFVKCAEAGAVLLQSSAVA